MNRTRLIALSLVATSLGAWAYLVPATINYLYYYPALDQLGVSVNGMSVNTYESNVTISFRFSISNPTPYAGLRLTSLAYQAKVSNETMDQVIGIGFVNPSPRLDPHSTVETLAGFVLTGLGMTQFGELCTQNKGVLSWSVEGTLGLETRDGVLPVPFQAPVTSRC